MQHLKRKASEKDAEHPYEEVLTYLTGKMDEDPEMQSYTDPYDNESEEEQKADDADKDAKLAAWKRDVGLPVA